MSHLTSSGVDNVIVGVLLIVIGAGMVLGGWSEIQAAGEWKDNRHNLCSWKRWTQSYDCPPNPYDADDGRSRLWTGLGVTIIGGVVLYYGTR